MYIDRAESWVNRAYLARRSTSNDIDTSDSWLKTKRNPIYSLRLRLHYLKRPMVEGG
jgi:hypothetical protein